MSQNYAILVGAGRASQFPEPESDGNCLEEATPLQASGPSYVQVPRYPPSPLSPFNSKNSPLLQNHPCLHSGGGKPMVHLCSLTITGDCEHYACKILLALHPSELVQAKNLYIEIDAKPVTHHIQRPYSSVNCQFLQPSFHCLSKSIRNMEKTRYVVFGLARGEEIC